AEPPRPAAAAPSPTPAPDPPAAAEALPAFSEADLDGLEIFDLDQPVAPVAPPEGPGWLSDLDQGSAAPAPGGKLFDDEQEFFDLAAELEEELKQEELGGENLFAQPHEQSLEEIVEGFKRGVAEHLSTEDYETHFNLGIAYREMGLLDEAIGEFQLASKSPARLVDCCSMLGISFLEKGLPELAVKWYRRGLDHPGLSEDESLALLYDLGNAYAVAGDREGAYKTFVEVYGTNSHYRDVVARLEELAP
ncbi:MAG TPA: tetratricopeptide repeat protein, partial [Thermoanaerobaculia bacterium]|nr:tetratricopeptide repeat protein [Thermoanaerobaculia bacterium]